MIAEQALPFAAEHLQAEIDDIQFAEGIFTAAGTNQSVTIEDVVRLIATDDPAQHPLNRINIQLMGPLILMAVTLLRLKLISRPFARKLLIIQWWMILARPSIL